MDLLSLLDDVKKVALGGADIMKKAQEVEIIVKGDQNFVTQVDLAVNDYVIKELSQLLPEADIFTEESEHHSFTKDGYTWIIDPIDGTNNFIFDYHHSCVSIALIHNNEGVLGVVYDPYLKEMFSAVKGHGAFLNSKEITVSGIDKVKNSLILTEPNVYGDRSCTITRDAIHNVHQVAVDYRASGSATLDICYIACGRGSAFFCQNINPWDFAAGNVILLEAGGKATRWDNSPFTYLGVQRILCSNQLVHSEMMEYLK